MTNELPEMMVGLAESCRCYDAMIEAALAHDVEGFDRARDRFWANAPGGAPRWSGSARSYSSVSSPFGDHRLSRGGR